MDSGEIVLVLSDIHRTKAEKLAESYKDPFPEFDRAIEVMRKACDLFPKNTNAYYFAGYAYLQKAFYLLSSKQDAREAFRQCVAFATKALQLESRNAGAYGDRGIAYYHLGECKKGLEDMETAIRLNPVLKKNYEEAIEDAKKQLRLRVY